MFGIEHLWKKVGVVEEGGGPTSEEIKDPTVKDGLIFALREMNQDVKDGDEQSLFDALVAMLKTNIFSELTWAEQSGEENYKHQLEQINGEVWDANTSDQLIQILSKIPEGQENIKRNEKFSRLIRIAKGTPDVETVES